MKKSQRTLILLLISLMLTACLQESTQIPLSTQTPTSVWEKTSTVLPSVTPTQAPAITIDPEIPEWVQEIILEDQEISTTIAALQESITIGLDTTDYLIGHIQYVPVVWFNTPITQMNKMVFEKLWSTDTSGGDGQITSIYITESANDILSHHFGILGNQVVTVNSIEDAPLTALMIIPFNELTPSMRVLRINNESFFSLEESLTRSMFSVPIYSSTQLVETPAAINFSTEKMATVNITGVTALTRATAAMMRMYGNQYPAEQISEILRDSDYTHISNEVSFAPDCPPQQYTQDGLAFCSPGSTFELLQFIDADIIELTGDHLEDWGIEALYYSLDQYQEAGMTYYGGGANLNEAQTPLKIEHNGNKFALIGCNAKNPAYSHAAEEYPGTWHCDQELLKEMILALQSDGYTPIVTMQHLENELITPPDELVADFNELARLEPIILVGSQSHVPKSYRLEENVFIHYGLGNLFFDQINESDWHAQALIDRLIFYNNKLISVEIFPIRFVDWAQSRPMTENETEVFLSKLFDPSVFTQD